MRVETYTNPEPITQVESSLRSFSVAVLDAEDIVSFRPQLELVQRSAFEAAGIPDVRDPISRIGLTAGPGSVIGVAFESGKALDPASSFLYGYVKLEHSSGFRGSFLPDANSVLLKEAYTRGTSRETGRAFIQGQGVAAATTLTLLRTFEPQTEFAFSSFRSLGEANDYHLARTLVRYGLLTAPDQLAPPDQYRTVRKTDSPNGRARARRLQPMAKVIDKIIERKPWLTDPVVTNT